MVGTKQKNLAALIGMALLHIYFLMTHFSTAGCVVTLLSIIYLFVSSYVLVKDSPNIISYTGEFLGATICDFALVTMFSMGATFVGFPYEILTETPVVLTMIGMFILFFVLKKIHSNSLNGKKIVVFVSKYLIVGIVAYLINKFVVGWATQQLIYILITYLLINVFFEQIVITYSTNNKKATAVFYWCYINVAIYACATILFPNIMISILSKISTLSMLSFRWYGVLIAILMFLTVGVYSWIVDSDGKVYPNDSKLCLALAVACGMIPFILSTYTRYCIIAFIILAILYFVMFFGVTKGTKYLKIAGQSFLKLDVIFIVGVLVLTVCQYAFIHGELFSVLIACIGILLGVLLYKFKSGKNGFLFWEYIVVAFAAYMCERVNRLFNYRNSYFLLIFIVVISSLALVIANVKNKNKFTSDIAMKMTNVICSCLLMFATVTNYGVKCDIQIENKIAQSDPALAESIGESNAIQVTLKARGKDNKVIKCYYYWNNELDAKQEVALDENNQFVVAPNNGELQIYAEDQYGVSSYKKQWFYIK